MTYTELKGMSIVKDKQGQTKITTSADQLKSLTFDELEHMIEFLKEAK